MRLAPPRPYTGPRAVGVRVGRSALTVTLADGRVLRVPMTALPGLASARPEQRRGFELLGGGIGIRFPQCDEDISVENLLQPQLVMHYRRLPRSRRDARPAKER